MKNTSKKSLLTVGIDLGDKSHEVCVLDAQATVVSRETILNNRESFRALSQKHRGALMIMEAGTHSPWISRELEGKGHSVIVANPRKVRAIYDTDNKTDERDAEMLARIGRLDPNLLYGITHKSEEHQRVLKIIDARDVLVSARVSLVNHVRSCYKSLGIQLPSGCDTGSFANVVREHLSREDLTLTRSVIDLIDQLSKRIKVEDKRIAKIIKKDFPVAEK